MAPSYGDWISDKMPFPHPDRSIMVDIETDTDMTRVWLIGVKIGSDEEQFLATDWLEERDILVAFTLFLADHPGKPLICYSTTNFDFRVLMHAAHRLKLSRLIEQMTSRTMLDMATLLRRYYTPYGRSYSLKLIRFLIGYRYDDSSLSGEDMAIAYYRQVRRYGKITAEFAKKAMQYNLDDIRVMYNIIDKFSDHIEFVPDYHRSTDLKELKHYVTGNLYSKNINTDYIRLSVPNDVTAVLIPRLMSHGVPLPEVKEGINVTALYWRSGFSYLCMSNLVSKLKLG